MYLARNIMSIGPSLPRGESLHKIVLCTPLQWAVVVALSTCSPDMWYGYQLRAACHLLRPSCCARYADFFQHLVYAFQKRWREMDDPLARLALLLDPRYKVVLAGQHQPLLQPVSLLCLRGLLLCNACCAADEHYLLCCACRRMS
jgi:hypothetical protein